MPKHFGYRAQTRYLFAKKFRKKGMPGLSRYLTTYRMGDYVDVVCDSAVHGGMPYKYYHGRTGVVWNVTPRAVGVEVKKKVGNRIIKKRIHVRVEHVRKSRCQEEFMARRAKNEILWKQLRDTNDPAEAAKIGIQLKRRPEQPKEGHVIHAKEEEVIDISYIPFELDV